MRGSVAVGQSYYDPQAFDRASMDISQIFTEVFERKLIGFVFGRVDSEALNEIVTIETDLLSAACSRNVGVDLRFLLGLCRVVEARFGRGVGPGTHSRHF